MAFCHSPTSPRPSASIALTTTKSPTTSRGFAARVGWAEKAAASTANSKPPRMARKKDEKGEEREAKPKALAQLRGEPI